MKKQDTKQQTSQEIEKINKQLEEEKRQGEEWKNKYLRALADYQNLERRREEENRERQRFAGEVILSRFLSAIDTLRRAKDHVKDAGLELAYKEFEAILEEQRVEKIETVGRAFNPHEMECIEVVAGQDNIVIEELLPGYRLHGKLLRVAQVKVGKNTNNNEVPA